MNNRRKTDALRLIARGILAWCDAEDDEAAIESSTSAKVATKRAPQRRVAPAAPVDELAQAQAQRALAQMGLRRRAG